VVQAQQLDVAEQAERVQRLADAPLGRLELTGRDERR
jgi:hypothetical protein